METLHRTTAAFLALVVILQAALVKSEATYSCKDHDVTFTDEQVARLKKCGDTVGVKSMEEMTPDKIPCFSKCMMETSGLVDDQGKPHKENIMRDIEKINVPANVKDLYKKELEKCIDEHGGGIKQNDVKCLSYSPLAMCVMKALQSICHG